MPPRVLGSIIAGGRSRRFGSDKAFAELDGRCLLDHVIAALALECDSIVICGRAVDGHICVADRPWPGLGPLGGLAAALHFASVKGFDAVLTSACDTPEIPADLTARLSGSGAATIAGQPLFGWWPASLSPTLDRYLAAGNSLAMNDWVASIGARHIHCSQESPNVNTPADLIGVRLRRLARPEASTMSSSDPPACSGT